MSFKGFKNFNSNYFIDNNFVTHFKYYYQSFVNYFIKYLNFIDPGVVNLLNQTKSYLNPT